MQILAHSHFLSVKKGTGKEMNSRTRNAAAIHGSRPQVVWFVDDDDKSIAVSIDLAPLFFSFGLFHLDSYGIADAAGRPGAGGDL